MQGGSQTGTLARRMSAAESAMDSLSTLVTRANELENRINGKLERYSSESEPAIPSNCKIGEEQILPDYFRNMRDHICTLNRCINRLNDLMDRCEL